MINDNRYYEKVHISRETFFENYFSSVKWSVEKSFTSNGEPVDKEEWGMTPPTWNAYYNPPGNEVHVKSVASLL
jgi:endothelin-converting enzyme